MTADVLIAGAGPAGLTLANDLASRGIRFRVIDPLPEAVRESRAHGILGRTLQALDKLGLAESMLAAAKKPTPVLREYFGNKLVAETDLGQARFDPYPYPTALPIFQQRVVRVLEAALAVRGHCVEWSTRLVSFSMDPDCVTAEVDRNGTRDTIRAKWIVGCEGSHSVVRKTLASEFPGKTLDFPGVFCECDLDWKRSRDIWWMWQGPRGLVATIYNDFTEKWHIAVVDLKKRGRVSESSDLERAGALLRQMSGDHNVRLSNPVWIHAQTSSSQRIAEHFVSERALLAGDAAHVFSSVAGYGVHCAIEDALNLGWKLGLTISGIASPSLLATYDTERRGQASEVVRKTRTIERFMRLRPSIRIALWAALYFVGKHLRSISKNFRKQSDTLVTDYRNSPLSRQDSTAIPAATRAGLHIPDGACRVGGRPSRLLEIIRGPQADLLLFAGLSPTPQAVNALRVVEQSVESLGLGEHLLAHYVFPSEAYAKEAGLGEGDPKVIVDGLDKLRSGFAIRGPELVYIRPDGFIGLRSQDLHPKRLRHYLGQIYRLVE
ncbi:MAG TPA: FAD-dependent monooxygenase [Planctomycetaceae bacterium]|nr:FAD-dependent monooxygenase [Planctomycetaceae bacterium]